MEDKHEKEREKKKLLSYICNWIGEADRNDLRSLTW